MLTLVCLGDSGIDISMFAPHSVRGASFSAARMRIGELIQCLDVSITNQCILQILVMLCYLKGSPSVIS